MSADLYAAWLTAGDRLQPIGGWLAANWWWLTACIAAAAFAVYAIRQALRDASKKVADILADHDHRETQPGSDADDLHTCLQILRVTDTREEDTRG